MINSAIAPLTNCWRGGLQHTSHVSLTYSDTVTAARPSVLETEGLRHLGEGSETLEN